MFSETTFMPQINKIKYLLTVAIAAAALIFFSTPEKEGFQGNQLSEAQEGPQLMLKFEGLIAAGKLDFYTVRDTVAYAWESVQPVPQWAGMRWGVDFLEVPENEEQLNMKMWAQLQFENKQQQNQWMHAIANSPLFEVKFEEEDGNVAMGYLTAKIPVPGEKDRKLEIKQLPFGMVIA